MKKFLLFSATVIGAFNLASQTTIASLSQIGYSAQLVIASAATATNVPVSTTGSGVTWDCSGLAQENGTPLVTFAVTSPTGTTYAADYPNANWFWTDPALSSLVGYHYYNLSADTFMLYGEHTPGSSYEIYDNPELEMKLPFSYGDVYSNTYSKTNYNANGSVSSYQTGNNTLTYDGFGTLILPCGTFTNVARTNNVRTNSLGATTTEYNWYLVPGGERLLNYQTNGGVKVIYVNAATTGIHSKTETTEMISMYPQPMKEQTIIHLEKNVKAGTVKIIDPSGKIISSQTFEGTDVQINRDGMNSGLYFVQVYANGTLLAAKKLIVE